MSERIEPRPGGGHDGADLTDHYPEPGRWHASYLEPHSVHGVWTSPPSCLPSRKAAEEYAAALGALAGPDARARRVWMIGPCDERCCW